MTEKECLDRMVAPGTPREGKFRRGVIQIHVTRACDKACFNCTQLSNLRGPYSFMSVDQFRQACRSLRGYFGVVGVFGGNPATHPVFIQLCEVMREEVPFEQRGLWYNNPMTLAKAEAMAATFNPRVSNLNVHLDHEAYDLFKSGWPHSMPCGLDKDSRHSPPWVAMRDVVKIDCQTCDGLGTVDETLGGHSKASSAAKCPDCDGRGQVADESRIYELVSNCDINQHWSAMICQFRGELRAFFCEIAGAQAMIHQHDECHHCVGRRPGSPDAHKMQHPCRACRGTGFSYPDTGLDLTQWLNEGGDTEWWQLPMEFFKGQVNFHCFRCGVPLRGHGELAQASQGVEQVSAEHAAIYKPKRMGREVQIVTEISQLGEPLKMMTRYLQNSKV